jgi:oxygen-independent coproporphyrinogen-3 oxidase
VYVHLPFCRQKCHYCDFYSVVDTRHGQPVFARRLVEEIRAAAGFLGPPLETIFFGGGTPTLLAVGIWQDLLRAVADHLPRARDCELTVEANPDTVSPPLVESLAAGGVNRLSIGAQSFQAAQLAMLQRRHKPANVRRSVRAARAAGIDNINLDLIFAVPGQTLGDWRADLDMALGLEPTHLSCYGLVYEPGTPLAAKLRAGRIQRVDEGLEAAMYEATIDRLATAGFEHYEISNWARPGFRCRHNLLYWTNQPWWPLGPGAAGHADGIRWKNVPRLDDYLRIGPLPPITDVERLDADGRVGEELMLRLRLIEGVGVDRLEELLAQGRKGPERAAAIERFVDTGWLDRTETSLRLTRRGLTMADSVVGELV